MSEDANGVTTLMLIFGAMLMAYGGLLRARGDVSLMPLRVRHSLRSAEDVRRVGRYVLAIGTVVFIISALARVLLH